MPLLFFSRGEVCGRWELTESAEDNKRERVANDPFADGSDDHENAAEEEICSWVGEFGQIG